MAPLPKILEWYSLTEMVNEFDTPAAFLKNLVFSSHRALPTENIVYRLQEKGRNVAPFVEKCSEAIMSGGYSEREVNFTAPNIRIKRPLDACDLIFRRHAGDFVFAGGAGDIQSAADREVALQLQALNDEVANAEEWLAAQAIRGQIDYVVDNGAAYTINMGKPAGNTIDLGAGNYWDGAGSTPLQDIKAASRVMHDEVSLNPMVAILGQEACDVFLSNQEIRDLLDVRRMRTGTLDLTSQLDEQGALPLGSLFGIDWWYYGREVSVGGTSEQLIRSKYVEFLNVSPSARNTMFYAAIPDLDALETGRFVGERFSKSWRQPDPSQQQILVHSRPLPVMQRPASSVSMRIVS